MPANLKLFEEPLITSPNGLIAALLLLLAVLYWMTGSRWYRATPVLRLIPTVFLVYLTPMVLNTLGVFGSDASRIVYGLLRDFALPLSLVLLLIGTDLPLILRLGPRALLLMVIASLGVAASGITSFALWQGTIGDPDLWRGVGSLCGSWIGGSANMIAIKEALSCPQHVFTSMTVVDVVVGYSWMIIVIALAGAQTRVDRWNRARTEVIDEINTRLGEIHAQRSKPIRTPALLAMLGIGAVGAHLCLLGGKWIDHTCISIPGPERLARLSALMTPEDWRAIDERLGALVTGQPLAAMAPEERPRALAEIDGAADLSGTIAARDVLRERGVDPHQIEAPLFVLSTVLNGLAIALIAVSLLGLALSLTPLRRLEDSGASEVGYALLFLTLASIGSRADLNSIFEAPAYLLLGATWIGLFAIWLFIALRLFRSPLFLVASASQANIGGAVSAPVVSAAYQPNLAVVGLLMAIVGQILGTFLGIGTGWVCSILAQ
ncbi:MAG: DUF819 family protein [Candidatus Sumerlaeia bacterium]|nr:DUF819 family protein [Candidatus Sumerlaeia bacterium]